MAETVVVLLKNGWYYCQRPRGTWTDDDRINGKKPNTVLKKEWAKTKSEPKVFKTWVEEKGKLSHYKIKDEFKGKFPSRQAVSFFGVTNYGGAEFHHEIYDLYERVYEKPKKKLEVNDWEIVIADVDCEPIVPKFPFKTSFPTCVEKYPQCHHNYPCSVSGDIVFGLIRDRISGMIAGLEHFELGDYGSYHLCLYKWVDVPFKKTCKVNINMWRLGTKPKYEKRQITREKIELLSIKSPSYTKSEDGNNVVPGFAAENYYELEKKVLAFVESVVSQINLEPVVVCPICKGAGTLVKEAVTEIMHGAKASESAAKEVAKKYFSGTKASLQNRLQKLAHAVDTYLFHTRHVKKGPFATALKELREERATIV